MGFNDQPLFSSPPFKLSPAGSTSSKLFKEYAATILGCCCCCDCCPQSTILESAKATSLLPLSVVLSLFNNESNSDEADEEVNDFVLVECDEDSTDEADVADLVANAVDAFRLNGTDDVTAESELVATVGLAFTFEADGVARG